ncbi:type II toxin-antitoxin system HipA family toxin [Thiohalophilus sp.]|uniref:type II toxin-antitoxin system HipA family toxin n=1 Tax=Thiohalophilus sp. TaxID=3028392 RepID=UPI002ACD23DC|nr:type II toxin-antitoxin system HipA family toxin [Thiohalophilus sp.]MDZ7803144.1 type II toxin-antitoxin system HipA family toxin [Thiohalophilus sp.]
MGRKRQSRNLDVYVGTSQVGLYRRAPDGSTSFRYDPNWLGSQRAFAISLSMPLSDRIWSGAQVSSVFDGLLPDDPRVRDKIAAREQAESGATFDLLAAIGRDCVGALRFVPEGENPGDPTAMAARAISDEEIAQRLAALGTSPLGIQGEEDEFRVSLAGVQEKTALLRLNGAWHLPLGPTPTSHIFKPALKEGPNGADFSDMPWNEWTCLEFCRALGLDAAHAEVLRLGGDPVLVVARFDRRWQDGILYRLPQEDLCQAFGVPPTRKYQSDGGPGIVEVMQLLNGAIAPYEDRLRFMKAQIVFWLLAAIDGHAKNFSVFLSPGGFYLTPLYDVMSAAPYPELSDHKVRLAMALGDNNHYRVKEIMPRHFYQTGRKAGLRNADIDDLFEALRNKIGDALAKVEALAGQADVPDTTVGAILQGIHDRARRLE